MNILVLEGGISNEREVSLRSSKTVKEALRNRGHEIITHDPADGLDGLKKYKNKVDVVFPILHGGEGENGGIQAILESHGFKFLGSGSKVSDICFDKSKFKKAASKLDVVLPSSETVSKKTFAKSTLAQKPFVIKPYGGGSSIDIFIIREVDKIPSELIKTLDRLGEMLIEELVDGTEITVPVLGNKALSVIEIIPPVNGWFDYENKYNGLTQELCPPKNISKETQKKAQKIAETVHKGLNMRHLSRTDMIVSPNNEVYVIETNTIPGMTDQSLFPKAARVDGISMEDLVEEFLRLAS
ncbi:MAG: D-alanine--D-alanine ligase [Candidatus Saccharibacteria bacterium]